MIHKFNKISPRISKSCFIAPNTSIIGNVVIGNDSSIWFGIIIRGDMHSIRIGDRTNIQDNSVVHVTTDIASTTIGDGVTIGHAAIIHGCKIKNNCLIGMGSIVMDNAIIGEGSIIAAGALISPNTIVKPRTLMIGMPAKPIRKVTDEEYEYIIESAEHYIEYSKKYIDN